MFVPNADLSAATSLLPPPTAVLETSARPVHTGSPSCAECSWVKNPSRHQESQQSSQTKEHPTQPLAVSALRGCSRAGQHCPSLLRRPRVSVDTMQDTVVVVVVAPGWVPSRCRTPAGLSPQLLAPARTLQGWRAGRCRAVPSGVTAASER